MIDHLKLKTTVEDEMARTLKLADLRCEISDHFGSEIPGHRLHIRQALHQHLINNENEDLSSIMDLRFPPRLSSTAISISHCPTLGGFVYLAKTAHATSVGFDIEIADRVSLPVAKKVLPHAVETTLHTVLENGDSEISGRIWAAKEAAIKCAGNLLVDRQIFYGNLALIEFKQSSVSSEYQFRAVAVESPTVLVHGIVRKTDQWIVALATSYSLPAKLEQ